MTIVYHYTTQQSAYNIIQTESLRFTNIHFLNDASEWRRFYDKAIEINEKHRIQWVEEMLRSRASLQQHLKSLKNEDADSVNSDMVSIFVACFTSAKDSAAQWANYCEKGSGICLGFDLEMLKNWINNSKNFADPPNVFADWVNYDSDRIERVIQDSYQKPVLEAILHKSPSYKSEEEYRIGYVGVSCSCYEFMPTQASLKCHITSKISDFRSMLKEVWIGSGANREAYYAWETLLNQKFNGNYIDHVALRRSKSGLRSC